MIQRWMLRASLLGWMVGVVLLLGLMSGANPSRWLDLTASGADASESRLTESEAVALASEWAGSYVQETLATEHKVDGAPISLSQMDRTQARFVPNARELVTSATTAVALPAPQDVWIISWERGGMPNVTTGRADGTAHIVIVLDDQTGVVKDAVAGIRQPNDQARQQRGELPAFEDILGRAIRQFETERAGCVAETRGSSGKVAPLICEEAP